MTTKRIYGLDAWRAGLLLVGPVIHSSTAIAMAMGLAIAPFGFFERASALFRMPVFFFIAGFLASHAQRKQGNWLLARLVQLGVPLISTSLLLMVPLIALRIGPVGRSAYDPQHLWFLIDLLLFSVVFYKSGSARGLASGFSAFPPVFVLVAFVLASMAAGILRYPLSHVFSNPIVGLIVVSPTWSIFYLGGFALQQNEALFQLIRSKTVSVGGVLVFVLVFAIINHYDWLLLLPHQHLTQFLLGAVDFGVGASMCCAVMASAANMTSRPAIVARLSRASYSIYLLHVPIITVAAPIIANFGLSVTESYMMLVATSFGLSWATHELVIQRSSLLGFLFNGRMLHVGAFEKWPWCRTAVPGSELH